MADIEHRFGDIALEKQFISQDKLDRALVIQRCIFNRTRVHMPIGKVLKEMGVLTQEQIDIVLEAQRTMPVGGKTQTPCETKPENANGAAVFSGLDLTVSKDRLGAFLSPTGEPLKGVTLKAVKELMTSHGIVYGILSDIAISAYLNSTPLPPEPFQVAFGTPPVEGHPPEIIYHFETDPLRVGTLQEDGTMDWKNRGDVPEVKIGDILAEKGGADPGQPGTTICGEEIPPPKIREPQLKCAKGVQRSEDGQQVIAKLDGTPKVTPDGRITVMSMLPIESDIGIETGHVDFDGYIEVNGGVCAGYTVKGRGLRTREIQNAEVDISEDLVSFGGIYGSSVKVGGNAKASHIHNTQMTVLGDLIVEKEIFGCDIEVSGQCIVDRGKIIGSKIAAKKGIQVHDVGTEASLPSELIVGIDFKFERDMQQHQDNLEDLENQAADLVNAEAEMKKRVDQIGTDLGETAQVQDRYMVQKRQLEEKIRGPKAVKNDDERNKIGQVIQELAKKAEQIDQHVNNLMTQDDQTRNQLAVCQKSQVSVKEQIENIKKEMALLEETQKVDPGIPIIKVNGTIYSRTAITGPHKNMTIPEDIQAVRIAESKSETGINKWQIKISNLR